MVKIKSIIWLPDVIEKLEVKHSVAVEEVRESAFVVFTYSVWPRLKHHE